MAIKASEQIWCNGTLIPWDDAKLHVMSHVVNYGSSVFEGPGGISPSRSHPETAGFGQSVSHGSGLYGRGFGAGHG
jgi:hypothetical protein